MSLDLTGPGPAASSPDPALARTNSGVWPLALIAVLIFAMSLVIEQMQTIDHLARRGWDLAIWLGVPLAAVAITTRAGFTARGRLRAAWFAFAAAVVIALVAHSPLLRGPAAIFGDAGTRISLIGELLLAPAIAAAAILATRPRALRTPDLDAALDAAVFTTTAFIILERFYFPILQVEGSGGAIFPAGLPAGLLSLLALCLAASMTLRPSPLLPAGTPGLLLASASALLLGGGLGLTPEAGADPRSTMALTQDRIFTLGGWLLLSLAGAVACRSQAGGVDESATTTPPFRLQQLLTASAVLTLGALAVSAALSGGLGIVSGGAAGLLALLLALRMGRIIQVDREHAEAQRLLAQNSSLMEVSRALADATDLNRILDLVVRWACKLLDAHSAALKLHDPEQDELEIRAVCGLPSHLLGLRVPVAGALTGSVIRSAEVMAVSSSDFRSYFQLGANDSTAAFPTAAAPLHYRDQRLGTIFALRFDRDFDQADLELLSALADQASLAIRNAQLFEEVRALSLTDPLTGLANRRQLARDLNREFAATRRGRRLIAVLFDMDNFKEYNDDYGHPAGDEVLRLFGQALASETRSMNLAARYGGDEFISLLADTSPDGARIFIDRVVGRFQRSMEELGRGTITVSAGLAECDPAMETPEELIAAADQAMYKVKPSRGARGEGAGKSQKIENRK